MNIVFCEPLGIAPEAFEALCAPLRAAGHAVRAYDGKPADADEMLFRAQDADIAVIANSPFSAQAVAGCPRLQYLCVAFTGVDHVAIDACRARGVAVSNAAGYSDQAVAELVIGQALALLRRLPACDAATRAGETGRGLRGGELAGRTVGVIGLGRIGLRVARLMQAFGARVIAHSPHERPEARALGIPYLPLDDLLRQSDIVTLHAPSTPATRGLMGAKQFALMKHGALFINCARGALVDGATLASALNAGRLAGAAVDVFPQEPPLPPDEPLLHAQNILLTPHVGFDTEESMLRRARIVFDNLDAYLRGEAQNLI